MQEQKRQQRSLRYRDLSKKKERNRTARKRTD